MNSETGKQWIADTAHVFNQQRRLAEGAAQQVDDDAFARALDPESNSIAVIMKHVGGNLRSRWTDFLTSDGEKPDRNRDGEFVAEGESRADIMRTWNLGWQRLEDTLHSLQPEDLTRTVTIRGEPCTVIQALLRNLAHASHHCGQIVFLAKAHAHADWQTLSIPRGGSGGAAGNFWANRP
jgi:hypothetical protein